MAAGHNTKEWRTQFQSSCAQDGLDIENMQQVLWPYNAIDPLDVLPIHHNGFKCNACSHVASNPKQAVRHAREEHEYNNPCKQGRLSKNSTVQRPWTSNISYQQLSPKGQYSRLFEVNVADKDRITFKRDSTDLDNALELAQTEAGLKLKRQRVTNYANIVPSERTEVNAWLDRNGWATYLAGRNREHLLKLLRRPDNNEALLLQLETRLKRIVLIGQQVVLTQTSTEARFVANRRVRKVKPVKPLQVNVLPATLTKYTEVFAKIVRYAYRTYNPSSAQSAPEFPPYVLDETQHFLTKLLLEGLNDNVGGSFEEDKLDDTDKTLLTWALGLFQEKLSARKGGDFNSVVVSALAVMAVGNDGGWISVLDYTPFLSAIIKIVQILVVLQAFVSHNALEEADHVTNTNVLTHLDSQIDEHFTRDSGTPLSWIFDARTYGMKIRVSDTAEGGMRWEETAGRSVLHYQDLQIDVRALFDTMHGLVNRAWEILSTEILFLDGCLDDLPAIPWDKLRDSTSNETPGHNFLDANPTVFSDSAVWLMTRIYRERPEFLDTKHENVRFNADWLKTWLNAVTRFEELLLVLVHMSAGQPARAPELLSLRHVNTPNGGLRNVLIENGLVTLITGYHKGYTASLKRKVVYRYLPREVGELLVHHISLVLPFKDLNTLSEEAIQDGYIWSPKGDSLGRLWSSERLKQQIERATSVGVGARLTVASYRQVIIAISRRYMSANYHFVKDPRPDATVDDEDGSEYEDEYFATRADLALDLQAGHGTTIAGQIYGRGIEELAHTTIDRRAEMRQMSIQYHKLARFSSALTSKHALGKSQSFVRPPITASRIARMKEMKEVDVSLLLGQMMGTDVVFRGLQQSIITDVMSGQTRILGIMGTGAGKSLTFMLPAFWPQARTTIVIVPMVALRADMKRRCDTLHIQCVEWDASNPTMQAKIVLVTPESAVTKGFWTFLNRLQCANLLDRIVIDECHTVLGITDDFRGKMKRLRELFTMDCQILMLTATLPPMDEQAFMEFMGITDVSCVKHRMATARRNVHYGVNSWDGKLPTVAGHIQVMVELGGKCIVYAQTKRMVEELAQLLDCRFFHADIGKAEKADILDGLQSGKVMLVVATNALGLGVDVSDIRLIVHVGAPRSLRDYAQESGRAGRDGFLSKALIYDKRVGRPYHGPPAAQPSSGELEMTQFVTQTSCRRIVLDYYLDGDSKRQGCRLDQDETLCDVCGHAQVQAQQTPSPLYGLEDNNGDEELWQEIVQATSERSTIQQALAAARSQPMLEIEDLEDALRQWSNRCTFCMLQREEGCYHKTEECSKIDQTVKVQCLQKASEMRGKIVYAKYSCCFKCGLPQWICARFDSVGEDSWRMDAQRPCQYPRLAIDIVVLAMEMEIYDFGKRTQGNMQRTGRRCRDLTEWFATIHLIGDRPKRQANMLTMTLLDFMRCFAR